MNKTIYDYKCVCGILATSFEASCWFCHFRHANELEEEE